MIEMLTDPHIWVSFLTLLILELVLGIDNVIFISILVEKLPEKRRERARMLGLSLAMFMRIGLLFTMSWIASLTDPLFDVLENSFSGRDMIMITGGLFLIWKSTREIHHAFDRHDTIVKVPATVAGIILQIILIDAVFSLDAIITAVGMVSNVTVIVAAIVVSVILMILFAPYIGAFVSANPPIKMIALAFLVVIGVVLIADGFGHHVPKGYIYFSLAFAVSIEALNMGLRKVGKRHGSS